MMRVLHIVPYFYQAWAYGGIPRLSYHLCSALQKLGVQVDVVTTDAYDRDSRQKQLNYEVDKITVRSYKNISNRLAYDLQLFFPVGLAREKTRLNQYDLVHIHGHRNLLNTRMASWAADKRLPIVFEPNGTLVNIERRQLLKAAYDILFGNRQISRTNLFLAVSEAEKKQFLELGIPQSKIRILPNGVYVEDPNPAVNFKEKYGVQGDYILYLGKLTPRKGIEYVIHALKLLPDKNLKAVIAGNDMGMLPRLKNLARELEIDERVIFTGILHSPWKEAAYREALVTIYAGTYEIFGLVQFESILCGTPAIVADDCGAGEWLKKSGGGYLVPYADPKAIAQIVQQLDRAKEKEKIALAQEWIRKNLSWEAVAQQLKIYYQQVLESRK
jgi:glycosyltransferase involved in cell wall biosynthesis